MTSRKQISRWVWRSIGRGARGTSDLLDCSGVPQAHEIAEHSNGTLVSAAYASARRPAARRSVAAVGEGCGEGLVVRRLRRTAHPTWSSSLTLETLCGPCLGERYPRVGRIAWGA